ncbi:MAG: SCP-2 sterol transfer family protein [Pseudobutyrivibrio sp.]|nr:SCP-2 sterol transfer family protein [Pseudobutyrivibrio sp.]
MKVNIYYGGRGLLEDPTLYVINKMEQVLIELQVEVNLFNIYEHKNAISMLPQTLKDADGIILATTVEWLGIGGYMNQFLDACWLYADKTALATTYMQPVVMSTTYGEREAMVTLENAWEILGGLPCSGFCGYVEDLREFRENVEYAHIIEKKVETLYRTISQHTKGLPTSNQAVTRSILRTQQLDLSPQESEQLSKFVSDDEYVQTQKADIADLTNMFRDMMGQKQEDSSNEYINDLKIHFKGNPEFNAKYLFMIEGKNQPLFVHINGEHFDSHYGKEEGIDVYMKLSSNIMDNIVAGRETFQRAFSVGDMTAKGNFRTLRMLDDIFTFSH